MKNPIFESASVAIAPRQQHIDEGRESCRQRGIRDNFNHALPGDRRLVELLGFDDAPAVVGRRRDALLGAVGGLSKKTGEALPVLRRSD